MAEKRRGLGRGIGALFPESQEEIKNRPIDVFFSGTAARKEPEEKQSPEGSQDSIASTLEALKGIRSELHSDSVSRVGDDYQGDGAPQDGDESQADVTQESKDNVSRETVARSTPGKATGKSKLRASANTRIATTTGTDTKTSDTDLVPVPGATFGEIPVTEIIPNRKQPRQIFDEDDLAELTASIREVGVLQPIVVRPLAEPDPDNPEARYELIMGERRWRASAAAGNDTVPAIVRRTENADLLRDALLENLHRTQLNALEEAAAYQQLLEDFACTQEELSRRIARSRPQISNTLRLLKLPPLVQRRVAAGVISAGHARALLGLTDPAAMERLAQRIVAEGLSVRAVEEIVALGDDQAPTTRTRRPRVSQYEAELSELALRLADRFDTRVRVDMGSRKGKMTIEFATIEDLNRILDLLDEDGVDLQ
ncbi:MAG: ParB/RepB/Spo0J family partition protein [Actinomycetaceae bacterium]|nr:ParB/RepB/Spo0J family partition protein [Actinomycetaceae bacterium]